MARHLSVASVIDKNKISSDTAWVILLEIHVVNPNTREVMDILRIARNNENITFGLDEEGQPRLFQRGNFNVNMEQRQGAAPSLTVTAQDRTRYIHKRMEDMAGGVFSEVVMFAVNTDRLDKPPEMEERFKILTSNAKDYVVTFQLGAENPLGVQFPRERQWKDRCTRRYRGYGCGYVGPMPTCSYTKDGANGCIAHANTINFRGLPGLVRMNI